MPPPKQKLSVTFRASDKGRGRVGLGLTVVDAVRVWPPRAPPVTAARAAQCQREACSRARHTPRSTNSGVTLRAGRHDKLTRAMIGETEPYACTAHLSVTNLTLSGQTS